MVLLFDHILACDTFLRPLILSIVTNTYLVIILVLFIPSSLLLLIWTSSRLISLRHRLSFNPVIKSPLYLALCHTNYVQSHILILLPASTFYITIFSSHTKRTLVNASNIRAKSVVARIKIQRGTGKLVFTLTCWRKR